MIVYYQDLRKVLGLRILYSVISKQVEDITAVELHKLLESEPDQVVLIDVRTPEEREVSQIPGKVLTPAEFDAQKVSLKNVTAVCYW